MTPLEAFALLEVAPGASQATVKAAYRALAKVWHPDRFPDDVPLQQRAVRKQQALNEAYATLRTLSPEELRGAGIPWTVLPWRSNMFLDFAAGHRVAGCGHRLTIPVAPAGA